MNAVDVVMRMMAIVIAMPPLLSNTASAQMANTMPLLTRSQCSQISQIGPGVFDIKGRLRIAGTDFTDTRVSEGTVLPSGVDVARYIKRSCFDPEVESRFKNDRDG